ncbi:MAG: hypothetical protein JXR97_15495, partial [Planctomycetes bacterium]|nr:hypothetical protein [Planctomycetota bacterium]
MKHERVEIVLLERAMDKHEFNTEKDLWRRFSESAQRADSAEELDPMLLASYLDGMASEEEVELVELAMLNNPALIEEVAELRSLASGARDSAKIIPLRSDWWQMAVAAAAVVVFSVLGFSLGREYQEETGATTLSSNQ